ncbi:MAG: cyclic nucleotide-binding domain-containing protein [Bdellovibrionales bacterium]|nr:cyclic nucleotide-binding domain-containing protein [Bdellovibrionales bacterium]
MSSGAKVIKKGEFLFKEGDKITSLHLIQQGAISVVLNRPPKNIEIYTAGASQLLGEQALNGVATYPFSALATMETKVLELPVASFKQLTDGLPQTIKVFNKSMIDRMRVLVNDLKAYKMDKDSSPCPDDQIARVFGSIFHVCNHKGEKDEADTNKVTIDWRAFRQYAQRVFGDSLKRLEGATQILVKLNYATYEMGKPPEDPEGPDQIMVFHLNDLEGVEAFFEFFQYYYFKNGRIELLKSDELATQLLGAFVKCAENLENDRHGAVTIEFKDASEYMKNEMGMDLKPDHLSILERRGIFLKRRVLQDERVTLSYDIKEFRQTLKNWRIIREIDKWNERGFVDMAEEENKFKKKAEGGAECPECGAGLVEQAKFCSECGAKIISAA